MDLQYLEIDHELEGWQRLSDERREAFVEALIPYWLYHEHALEGIPLSPEAIRRSLADKPCRNYCDTDVKRSLRLLAEAIRSVAARAVEGREVSGPWVRDLHRRLSVETVDEAEQYRDRDTSPGVYNLDIVPSEELPEAFESFIDGYDDVAREEHPVRGAATAHWECMHLFPFDDRTGLVGRMLLNYHLLRAGYPPAVIHAEDRHHYFQALRGPRQDTVPVVVEALEDVFEVVHAFEQEDDPDAPARLLEFGDPAEEGRRTL